MKLHITSHIPVGEILEKRGLGNSNGARLYLADRVKFYSAPYVPKRQGRLRDARVVEGGRALVYNQPYAHYQYYGRVMGPNVLTKLGWRSMAPRGGKHYTGAMIKNSVGGPEWDKRMLADRRKDLEAAMAAYIAERGTK